MSRWSVAALVTACAMAAGAGTAEASTWSGSTYSKVQRSNRVVGAGYVAHGNFWFHAGRGGAVHGRAVVAYEGNVDTDRINAFVSYIKSVGGVALSALPLLGPYVSLLATNEIIGVRAAFDQPATIHQGAISGSLRHGSLSLRWAGAAPKGLPFRVTLAALHGDKPITHTTLPVETPWHGRARVAGAGAIAVLQGRGRLKGGTLRRSGYWTAHRIR